jgi:hypothetical protein
MHRQGALGRSLRVGAALLVVAGCGQILGVSDYRVRATTPKSDAGAPDAGASALVPTNAACGACVQTSCATALRECEDDEPCSSWQRCMARCAPGKGDCEHACFVQAGKTDRQMGDVAMCTLQYCVAPCQANGPFSAYGSGCASAVRTDCATQFRDCAGDTGCINFYKCLFAENCLLPTGRGDSGTATPGGGGQNPSCVWVCVDQARLYAPKDGDAGLEPSTGMALYVEMFFQPDTYTQCVEDDLTCAGQYGWIPAPRLNQEIEVTVRVHDGAYPELPGLPLANVRVRACAQNGDSSCDEYATASSQNTATDGTMLFTMPTQGAGLRWYFEVTPNPAWPLGPSAILFHTGRPLTRDTFLSLALGPSGGWGATPKDPKNALTHGDWDRSRAGLIAFTRSCSNELARDLTVSVDGEDAGTRLTRYVTSSFGAVDTPGASTVAAYIGGIAQGLHTVRAYEGTRKVAEEPNVMFQADGLTVMNWFAPTASSTP